MSPRSEVVKEGEFKTRDDLLSSRVSWYGIFSEFLRLTLFVYLSVKYGYFLIITFLLI